MTARKRGLTGSDLKKGERRTNGGCRSTASAIIFGIASKETGGIPPFLDRMSRAIPGVRHRGLRIQIRSGRFVRHGGRSGMYGRHGWNGRKPRNQDVFSARDGWFSTMGTAQSSDRKGRHGFPASVATGGGPGRRFSPGRKYFPQHQSLSPKPFS